MKNTSQSDQWEWNLDRAVMLFAGSVILFSLLLSQLHSEWWLLLTALAGLNLIQSVFTGFCPPAIVLRKLGLRGGCAFTASDRTAQRVDGTTSETIQ